MAGHAGSPTRIVYVDVTLTRSNVKLKVKFKVTDLVKLQKSLHWLRLEACVQSSNWTSDLFSTYSYIFNVN